MADLSVRGVWQPQTEALFVVDTDAQSYASRSVNAVLASAERQKKGLQCRHIMLLFLHLYSPLMGSWHMRLGFIVHRFVTNLSTKWCKSYGEVMGWVKARLSFTMLRATNRSVDHG